MLAFFFGYLLTYTGVRRAGADSRTAVRAALASDTVSILTMEIVDNVFLLLVPGAMAATLDDPAVLVVAGRLAGRRVRRRGAGQPLADGARQGPRGRPPVPRGARRSPLTRRLPVRSAPCARLERLPSSFRSCSSRSGARRRQARRPPTPDEPEPDPGRLCPGQDPEADGVLTVGTDSPAYDPWFRNNDPTNGKGYESAVAYAVAKQLGFDHDAR